MMRRIDSESGGAWRMIVIVHDVAPVHDRPLAEIVGRLKPFIGNKLAAAVVPCWHGKQLVSSSFAVWTAESFGELLLHGYTHRRERGRGAISMATRGADEFNGLEPAAIAERLCAGQRVLADVFGAPARGFIAPAWQLGQTTRRMLSAHGICYEVGFTKITMADARRIPISTCGWDLGVLP